MKHAVLCLFCACTFISALASQAQQSPVVKARQEENATRAPALSKIAPAKEADILRLMQLTGGDQIRVQLTKTIQASLRPRLENSLPPGEYRAQLIDLFLDKFGSKLTDDVILPMLVSVYDRRFSDDELKQLIAFYESPLGKKAASVLADIDAQTSNVQESGDKLAHECMAQVLAEHPDLQKAMDKAEMEELSE